MKLSEAGGNCGTVLLFAKLPVPGRVKTRLIGALTATEAARLHAAFLADVIERLQGQPFALVPVWALERDELIPSEPAGGLRQVEGDLGARMRHTFAEILSFEPQGRECPFAVAIGSDLPQIEPERIEQAFDKLAEGADVVLGPARDGGYYLIGLGAAALDAPIFEGIAWSTESVLEATLECCREAGLTVELLPEEEDIDTAESLARFAGRLAMGGVAACPRTAAQLAVWGGRAGRADTQAGLEDRCAS